LTLCSKCDEEDEEITSESEIDLTELNAEELTPVEQKALGKILKDNCFCRKRGAGQNALDLKEPDKYRLEANKSPNLRATTDLLSLSRRGLT